MKQFRVTYVETCERVSIIEAWSEAEVRAAWESDSSNDICDQIFDYSVELSTYIDNEQPLEIKEILGVAGE